MGGEVGDRQRGKWKMKGLEKKQAKKVVDPLSFSVILFIFFLLPYRSMAYQSIYTNMCRSAIKRNILSLSLTQLTHTLPTFPSSLSSVAICSCSFSSSSSSSSSSDSTSNNNNMSIVNSFRRSSHPQLRAPNRLTVLGTYRQLLRAIQTLFFHASQYAEYDELSDVSLHGTPTPEQRKVYHTAEENKKHREFANKKAPNWMDVIRSSVHHTYDG